MTIRLLAVTIAIGLLSGCVTTENKEVAQEKILLESGDSKNIIKFYKQNLNIEQEYRAKLVNEYLAAGDLKSAKLYANTYSKDDVNKPIFLLTLAKISILEKQYLKAENQLKQYLERDGDALQYHLLIAKVYAHQRNYIQAESHFLEAKKLGAEDVRIANDLAVLNMMQHKYSEAVDLLQNVYIQDPSNKKLRANLLLSAVNAGNDRLAMEALLYNSTPELAKVKLDKLKLTVRAKNISVPAKHKFVIKPSDGRVTAPSKNLDMQTSKASQVSQNATNVNKGGLLSQGMTKTKALPKHKEIKQESNLVSKKVPRLTKTRKAQPKRKVKVDSNYRIQILATYQHVEKEYLEYLKSRFDTIYEYEFDSMIRYCVGDFTSLSRAKAFLKSSGLKDGFVVNYGTKEYKTL